MQDLTWPNLDSAKSVAAAAGYEEQTMNMITPENFAKLRQDSEANPALAKLMATWEKKLGQNAKRAAGFGLVAVSLAACGGSRSTDNGENGNGNGEQPSPAGATFTVIGFPTQETPGMFVIGNDGVRIPADQAVQLLGDVLSIDMGAVADRGTAEQIIFLVDQSVDIDLAGLSAEDINSLVQSGLGDAILGGGGAIIIDGGAGQVTALDMMQQLLTLVQYDVITTVGRVILTPSFNGGNITSSGVVFGPGDQFSSNLTQGVTGAGDDMITFSALEFFHGAIIDGGAGADTIRLIAKTPYAQPTMVTNVQTIEVAHQPNVSNLLTQQINSIGFNTVGFSNTVLSLPDLNSLINLGVGIDIGSWIDLGGVMGLETLRISDASPFQRGDAGSLYIVGVESGASVVLTNSINSNVSIDFGFGSGAVVNVVLDDVDMAGMLNIGHNSPTLRIESTGTEGSSENYVSGFAANFGGNLRLVEISGGVFLHIDGTLAMNTARATTLDASANTAGVKVDLFNGDGAGTDLANNHINVVGSQGDDSFTLTAHSLNIVSTGGTNTFDMAGTYVLPSDGVPGEPASLVTGLRLTFDGAETTDTLVFNLGVSGGILYSVDEPTVTLLQGSVIGGANNTLVAFDPTDFSQATLEGIVGIVMNGTVTVTSDQLGELGAGIFSAYRSAEVPAITQNINVLVDGDVTLSELITTADLSSNVKLTFFIPEGASLTLTAEELHNFLAIGAIELGDGSDGTSAGKLTITDAGQNFDPFNSTFVGPDGLPVVGGGTILGANNNLTVERSADGFDRPSQTPIEDDLVIDSSAGPVEVNANDFGDDEQFTIPQTDTLILRGENSITFNAPVSFNGTQNFTVDFSGLEGALVGLEIVDFQDITAAADPADWGKIVGNGLDARVDVQIEGAVGNVDNGLKSTGVATYVVTGVGGGVSQFWVSNVTVGLGTLGFQGNADGGVIFGNVKAGTTSFLLEGDGFANASSQPKGPEFGDEDTSNIGAMTIAYAAGTGTANANITINNQGVALGEASDGSPRALDVAEIRIINAEVTNVSIAVADGDAVINSITGVSNVAGFASSTIESVTITSANDVTLLIDAEFESLETFDATGVDGTMTLSVDGAVDVSEIEMSGVDAIVLQDGADLTMTQAQLLDIGIGAVSVEGAADGNEATLTIAVTEDFDVDALNVEDLPEGLTLTLSIQSEVEFNITGDQALALAKAGVVIIDGSDAGDEPGTLNITDFNQSHLTEVDEDGNTVNFATEYGAMLPDLAAIAGTITLEGGNKVFVPTAYGAALGNFAWELEGGTLGISNAGMANELVVNNGDVEFYFISYGGQTIAASGATGIDASGYTNIGTIFVTELFRSGGTEFNVETIAFLADGTTVEVVPLAPLEFDGANRLVVVGGVPFAIADAGPLNPVDGDPQPGPVVQPDLDLVFNNVSGNTNLNVETVAIVFEVGGNELRNIEIGAGALATGGNPFEVLTLISNGDETNTVADIFATGNDLLSVEIVANQEFVANEIILSSLDPDGEATVTVSGTADVELKAIVAGANVVTVTVNTVGHTGTLDLTGGSPSIEASETLIFEAGEGSTVLLDTDADTDPGGASTAGINGNLVLALLDASGAAEGSTLALGRVENVSPDGFTFIGGAGLITAEMVFAAFPAFDWSFDISDAADGSAIDFNIGGNVLFTLQGGSISLIEDEDTGETTLTFDEGTTLFVNSDLPVSALADNVVFGEGVEIILGEDGLVRLSDEDFAAFVDAGGTVGGDTEKTFDAAAPTDLSDVRGLTQIDLEEGTGPYTLDSAQVGIARPVDADGEPLADNGDLAALKDAGVIEAVVVAEGDTFTLTDVVADGLAITGEGSVTVEMVGQAGATLSVTQGSSNAGGQSITIPYTLGGVAGSVSINNSSINFTQPGAMSVAIAAALTAVDGLTATGGGGEVEVIADEAGVPFTIGTIATVGADVAVASQVAVFITSDMSGITVADLTHVFEDLATGGYDLAGAFIGGAPNDDGDVVITLQGNAFIDITGVVGVPTPTGTGAVAFVIDGNSQVKFPDGALTGDGTVTSTGTGSIQVQDPAGADLSGVAVPVEFLLTGGATFTGEFNGAQPVTVTKPDAGAPEYVLNIEGAEGLPSKFVLAGTSLELTILQADGLIVEGGSSVFVTVDGSDADQNDTNAVLSTIDSDIDLVFVVDGTAEFGGELPGSAMTVEGGGNLILKPGVAMTVSSITVNSGTTLTLTGAQASGLTIEGEGNVSLTEVSAGDDLDGIAVEGNLSVVFNDATASEFTLPAAAVAGNTVTVENEGGGIDLLTITGVDGSNADFSGLTVTAGEVDDEGVVSPGEGDVTFAVVSTGGFEFGEDTDFGLATAGDVTVAITGTGVVTVDEDADLSDVAAFTVGAGSTLVADQSATGTAVVNTALVSVSGAGRLQFTELDGETVAATDDVRTNEFVFDSADTGVTINGFEAVGALNGRFIFDDEDPLDPVLGTMRLDLSDFETNGNTVVSVDDLAELGGLDNFANVGVIIIEDGADPIGLTLDPAAEEAKIFFAHSFGGGANAVIEYWDDANGDGVVDGGELTLIATLNGVDVDDLGSSNFLV